MRLTLAFVLSLTIHTTAVVGILSLDPPESKPKSERIEVNLSYFKKPEEKKTVRQSSGKKSKKKATKKETPKRKAKTAKKTVKKVAQKPNPPAKKQMKKKLPKEIKAVKKEPAPSVEKREKRISNVNKVVKKEPISATQPKKTEVVKKEEAVNGEIKKEPRRDTPLTEETTQLARAEAPNIPEDYYYRDIPVGIDEEEEEEEFVEEGEELLPTPAGEEESQEIKRIIETFLTYPPIARRMGWEGTVVLRFILSRDGSVKEKEITKSSGYEVLDKSALRALELASGRFPKPDRDLVVVIPIVYRLEN